MREPSLEVQVGVQVEVVGSEELLDLVLVERIGRIVVQLAFRAVVLRAVLTEDPASLAVEARHISHLASEVAVIDEGHVEDLGDDAQLLHLLVGRVVQRRCEEGR